MKFKESETREFKKSTSELKEAVISIAAMLNKHGRGEVYFGIKNDGSAAGQPASEKTLREVSRAIGENIEPKIYPQVKFQKIQGKLCICVKFKGADAPYFAYGRVYMRVADEDRQVSAKQLEMNWRVEIPGMQRKEIPEVPIQALREAIINSFCHRDYYAPESNYIALYKNRIEITNPGKFPEGLTPQDFIEGDHESVLCNPLIADILYKSKEIEHWGSGLRRIYDECKASSVKVKFEIRKGQFAVVFPRPVRDGDDVELKNLHGSVSEKTVEKTVEKILEIIKKNPAVTQSYLAQETGLTRRGVEWNLKQLKQKGIIKRIGPDKGGHWEIDKGRE